MGTITRLATSFVLAAATIVGLGVAGEAMAGSERNEFSAIKGRYVTEVTGTARNGFTVHWSDGAVVHQPALSEAKAECSAYRRKARRRICVINVHNEAWHYALLKRSINKARSN